MPEERIPIDQLLDQQVLREVNEALQQNQDHAKLSIGEVTRLTGATYAQLRYWERKGLIQPQRGKQGRSVREYSLRDLRRALWLSRFFSQNGSTPKLVKKMLGAGSPSGDSVLQAALSPVCYGPAVSLPIEDHINHASKTPLFSFLAPQVGKACLSLICDGLYPDTGFAVAMPCADGSFPEAAPHLDSDFHYESGRPNQALVSLGKSILCFYDNQGLVSLLTERVLYLAQPTDTVYTEISCDHVGRVVVIGVHKHELGEAARCDKDNPRHQVLWRLLGFLLELMQEQEKIGHLSPVYSVHARSGISTQIRLDHLADIAVRLGEDHWHFCCVLAPGPGDTLWDRSRLKVVGRSRRCPHGRDTILERREGISSLAYELGQIVYVPDVTKELHLIARRAAEKNVKSAIAVPAAYAGQCKGVLYVASTEERAFNESDEIVLSLLGAAVAQVLTISSAAIEFDDTIRYIATHPRVSDPRFSMFGTRRDLRTALITKIQETQKETADTALSLLVIDINSPHELRARDGTREEWLVRRCWQHVGETTLRMLQRSPAAGGLQEGVERNYQLYRTDVGQYVAILETASEQWLRQFGPVLQQALSNAPIELQANSHVYEVDVQVRVAACRNTPDFLRTLASTGELNAVERLTQLLRETLEYARGHGSVAFMDDGKLPEGGVSDSS